MVSNRTLVASAIGLAAVVGASFYGGMLTQKSLNNANSSSTQSGGSAAYGQPGGGFGGGGSHRGNAVFGTVQSITGSSMTVSTQSGAKTVSLAGNPVVSDSTGAQTGVSSIQAGDAIVAFGTPNSDGSITATRVRLNPAFPGGGTAPDGSSSGSAASGT